MRDLGGMSPSVDRVRLDVEPILPAPLRPWSRQLEPMLYRLFVPAKVDSGLRRARNAGQGAQFARSLLSCLGISFAWDDADAKRIPETGPAVIVANHPYGIAEGLIMAVLLDSVRPDWKILTNAQLAGVREFGEYMVPVDPFGSREAAVHNRVPLRRSIEWLERGGALAAFPAGEVAHIDWKQRTVADPEWKSTAARLALRARCPVIPIYFEGANSLAFHLAGVLHPTLRTVGLAKELAKLSGKAIRLRAGSPIAPAVLMGFRDAENATQYLRSRTLLLSHRPAAAVPAPPAFPLARRQPQAIAPPEPERLLSEEVAALPADSELARQGDLSVHIAEATQIPHLLREIGRCRELTFREVGEGTGKGLDLDSFDRYYRHLILWDAGAKRLAGAYRLAVTEDVLPRFGTAGLYSSTLFRFDRRFFEKLGPAVELGRSFIMASYQRDFAPLLLLWKGIMRLIARRPEAPLLFGAVSISREYSSASRGLIAGYLSSRHQHPLAPLVTPRRRLHDPAARARHLRDLAAATATVEELSLAIADVEGSAKGVPVLLRQYLKTGGQLLGLSVDPRFSNTLDALILTDLRLAPSALLERCMGKAEARKFLAG
jgi:putative hemolysin